MTKIDLGRITPTYRGDYDSTVSYNELDIVYDDTIGKSFIAKQASRGKDLPVDKENEYWGIIAKQGPKGTAGEVGPKGDKGAAGDQGIQGERGPKGDQGDQGPRGPQGIQGDQGVAGPKGDKGDQGPRGPQGIQGEMGQYGTNLIENSDFFNGLTGWTVNNTDTGKMLPFRTHDVQINDANVVEFDTTSNGASSYGQLFKQLYFDMSPTNQVISISWWSKALTTNLYSNWAVRFYDSNNKELFNNTSNTRYNFAWVSSTQTVGAYVFNKKENITVPDNTYRLQLQIETREGNNILLAKPRMVIGSTISDGYVSGQNTSFSDLITSNLTVSGVLSSK